MLGTRMQQGRIDGLFVLLCGGFDSRAMDCIISARVASGSLAWRFPRSLVRDRSPT